MIPQNILDLMADLERAVNDAPGVDLVCVALRDGYSSFQTRGRISGKEKAELMADIVKVSYGISCVALSKPIR